MKSRKTVMRDKAVTSRLVSAATTIWAKRLAPIDQGDDHPDRERHQEAIAQHQHRWGRY
jgi:hypothetical protein